MKAIVLYYSHKGKTAGYAREIALHLWTRGWDVSLSSLSDFDGKHIREADLLITGCWTCGWFVVGQHPHQTWVDLSRPLAGIVPPERTLFFTTYKIRTGSLFRKMKKVMRIPHGYPSVELKSKTGLLSAEDKKLLDRIIQNKTSNP